jgi:hypothetical protein
LFLPFLICREVVRRLPELGFLDTRKIKQGVDNHPTTQLPPIRGNFFDAPNRQALADGFLQKYVFTSLSLSLLPFLPFTSFHFLVSLFIML